MKQKKAVKKTIKKAAEPKKKKVQAAKKKTPVPAKKNKVVKKKTPAVKAKKLKISKPVKKVAIKNKKVAPAQSKKVIPAKKKPVKLESIVVAVVKKKVVKAAKPSQAVKKIIPEVKPDPVIPGWTKVQFEYYTRSSVGVLYNSFSNASGLSSWFADNVDSIDNVFTFKWDGSEESAVLVEKREHQYVRFHWLEQPKDAYFEFRIKIDSITNEAALIITDYVEKGEENEAQMLWDSQVHQLMHILGS